MSCLQNTADLRPAQYNISLWRNDSWMQTFAIKANDIPVDLTGSTILIQIRKKANASTIDLSLTNGDGISIIGDDMNMIVVSKKVEILAGNYVYDINVTFPSGEVKTYVWGNFLVQEDVSKA